MIGFILGVVVGWVAAKYGADLFAKAKEALK